MKRTPIQLNDTLLRITVETETVNMVNLVDWSSLELNVKPSLKLYTLGLSFCTGGRSLKALRGMFFKANKEKTISLRVRHHSKNLFPVVVVMSSFRSIATGRMAEQTI